MWIQRKLEKRQLFFGLSISVFLVILYDMEILHLFRFPQKYALEMPTKCSMCSSNSSKETGKATFAEIALWISPSNPPSSGRQNLMQEMADKMNSDFENSCRDVININTVAKPSSANYHCQFVLKRGNISDSDAVLFFMFLKGYKLSELPKLSDRRLDQLWVAYIQEPPAASRSKDPLQNIFNWTMTNRMDSDIWTPYGRALQQYFPNQTSITVGNSTLKEWISGKSKLVVGVMSNCVTQSKRESLIAKMNKTGIAQIDIFGKCGQSPLCGRWENDCSQYWEKIAREYKFFLAFENSLCKDYITEKFWRSLALGMVPVVYGAGQYLIEAPPQSYIDVNEFSTVENLMKYIKMLDNDEGEYSKYFEWRKYYKASIENHGWNTYGWCNLCKSVIENKRNSKVGTRKSYENLQWWFDHQPNSNVSICAEPPSKFL